MDQNPNSSSDNSNDPLREFLESLLGEGAAYDALEAMRTQGFDLSAFPGLGSPQELSQALGQMRFMMNSSTEPVNWRMVDELSRQQVFQSGDPRLTAAQAQGVRQALSVADLWLDPVTAFAVPGVAREAWSKVEWIDQTLPAWKRICNPIAENASRAMADAMQTELGDGHGLPEGMDGLAQSISSMLPKMAAMAFAAQIGSALTEMAKEALGTTDSGLPLTEGNVTALIPANLGEFADGLDVPFEEVEQFMAARECAHARLFASVPWLKHDLLLAIERYSSEISIDQEAIMDAARSVDPSDPESIELAMSDGVFSSVPTEAQKSAQERLESLLALIEGWVEVVTTEAISPYLPHANQMREMMRRRRVTGSSGEMLLRRLVGIELRPRHTRSAATIFRRIQEADGAEARDALWSHPDRVPSPSHLAEPETFFDEKPTDPELSELDSQLSALLEGTLGFDDSVPKSMRGEEPGSPAGSTEAD
ncbi:zinc-dependent metalloprotease [Actinomyces minihominis]|uniref:zinc-dependent metalloprotease n=1 Tax=Actinomyces minihominis TaxID=2002838 RepID=UPI000C07D366|nr:zinc-dependent metalloprotease [Actinomyces minihominis]